MFSSRLPADPTPNALSLALERRRSRGLPILDLTESNPTRVGLRYDAPQILAGLARPEVLSYDPCARGLRQTRELIAALASGHGATVDPERIVLCASTSEAYGLLFKLLLDPGDEVLVPRPSYPLLELLGALEGVRTIDYPLSRGPSRGWRLDLDALAYRWSARSKAVVVVHPNNPTGNYLTRADLDELDSFCAERGAALIVDEVFFDYRAPAAPTGIRSATGLGRSLGFVLNGASKTLGLPQLKLAWIVVTGPEGLAAQALARLDFAADLYLSVAGPVQHAAEALLATRPEIQSQIRRRVDENECRLRERVGPAACPREGGWSAVVHLGEPHSDEGFALDLLREDGVLVHPGYFYGFVAEDVVVISLLPGPELFDEAVIRLKRHLHGR